MTKIYAGILGSLAFATTVTRGLIHGAAVEPTLWTALGCLAVFAVIGLVVGSIAERTVIESVSQKFGNKASPAGGAQTPAVSP